MFESDGMTAALYLSELFKFLLTIYCLIVVTTRSINATFESLILMI